MVCAKWDLMFRKTCFRAKEIITIENISHYYIARLSFAILVNFDKDSV